MILAFDVSKSNWVLKRGFPTFLYNAVRFLGAGDGDVEQAVTHPGDALRVPLPPGTTTAKITRPDGGTSPLTADDAGLAYFAGTRQVGVYAAEPGVEGQDRYAVNLEDDNESHHRAVRRAAHRHAGRRGRRGDPHIDAGDLALVHRRSRSRSCCSNGTFTIVA